MNNEHNGQSNSEPVIQTQFDSDERASEAVIRALEAIKGVEPTELESLYESLDPEALDALLGDPALNGTLNGSSTIAVNFVSSGYRVIVSSDGQITIQDGQGK